MHNINENYKAYVPEQCGFIILIFHSFYMVIFQVRNHYICLSINQHSTEYSSDHFQFEWLKPKPKSAANIDVQT